MPRLFLVGEAWGEKEEALQRPFVGPSGILLLRLLHQAGIITLTAADEANISEYYRSHNNPYFIALIWEAHQEHVYVTNVFNLRPQPSNDVKNLCGPKIGGLLGWPSLSSGKYVRAEYAPELDRLFAEVERERPNLIVALGATPSWALLRTSGIRKIRGATAQSHLGVKVLPTYHPAAVLREYSLRPIVFADLKKAARENAFPEVRRPAREIWIEPSIADLGYFKSRYLAGAPEVSADIETKGDQITCVGFAATPDRALVVPFFDPTKPNKNYWPTMVEELEAWAFVREVLSMPQVRYVGQNFIYDMTFLWAQYGIPLAGEVEDTMLLHHALQPEMEKGLGFLGSVYTDEPAWKVMRGRDTGTIKRED